MKKYPFLLPIFVLLLLGLPAFSPGQFLNTSLHLTVLDDLGNPVEDARVTLYNSSEDYRKETNPATETENTDKKGRAKFSKLDAQIYYIHVIKGEMTNDGAAVATDTLQKNRINKSTIIIE